MSSAVEGNVSVCLLTYNHVHLVESTLASILDQTISDYEVVVSDDGSTDGSWELLQSLARSDKRVRLLRTPRNLGMAGNANFAVERSGRPYVALLHHDDLYRRDLLAKWGQALEEHPRAAFVFNSYAVFGQPRVYEEAIPGGCIGGDLFLRRRLLAQWGCPVRGTAMFRRNAWNEVGGMRERFGPLSDVDLWMRFARRWPVAYVAEPLITVRQERPDSYPDFYKATSWSWRRLTLLYEIHAVNWLGRFPRDTLRGSLRWWKFRSRVNWETGKWLVYGVVRGRQDMVASSGGSVTPYDFLLLGLLRGALSRAYPLTGRR